jgi:hypothetical protein
LVGDLNLQSACEGSRASCVAAKLGGELFNKGTMHSMFSPSFLDLTAFGRRRSMFQEQISKAGKPREKPSMCILAPSTAYGNSAHLVSVEATPCAKWPWDHVAIVTTIQSDPGRMGAAQPAFKFAVLAAMFAVWFLVITSMQ